MDAHSDRLKNILNGLDLTFSSKLLKFIAEKGRKPVDIYTAAGVTKENFSKIKKHKDYHPTKGTALALAVALQLSLEETKELLLSAGYALSPSLMIDVIVEFHIKEGIFSVDEINIQLHKRGYKPLINRKIK